MIGTTISHYRIVAELGRGGMGIVYKAEDTKLDRTVAIKVLPSAALASKDDRERFYREAKSAAALNHPHIAQVYEIDEAVPSDAPHGTEPSPFIAMEFIDGKPLDEEVKQAPLKLEKAVALGIQIAQALEAAHDKNIVHRDIKSANVMLTAKGQAKVLDFGLAKTAHSTMLTRMGSTLGTVAYMSPEQARGEEVDHRTDLWALGVVLYELISGRNPFAGDYEQAVVYSILNEPPQPLTAVRTGVPMQLEWIVDKCLAKEADARYQSAKDLIVDLKKVDIASGSGTQHHSTASRAAILPQTGPVETAQTTTRPWPWAIGALLLGVLLTFGILTITQSDPPEPRLTRVDIALPALSFVRFPTMSPNGEYLAVVALDDTGNKGLFLREMSTGNIQFITGSEEAGDRELGFSPDGTHLAFNASANDGLFTVDIPTGIPARLTNFGRFAYWESNNVIVMTDDRPGGSDSYRVALENPEPIKIEELATNVQEGYSNVLKTNVPGTQRAFGHQLVRAQGGNQDVSKPATVYAFNSEDGEVAVIVKNALNPYYVSPGFLLYQIGDDSGPIVARKLNDDMTDFAGQPREILGAGEATWGDYLVTPQGDLMYLSSGSVASLSTQLWEVDLINKNVRQILDDLPVNAFPSEPSVSSDGRLLAYSLRKGSENANIHLYDLKLEVGQQITFQDTNMRPVFSPDGKWLYWTRVVEGAASIYRQPVDQSASAELFVEGAGVVQISPDDRLIAYTKVKDGRTNLFIRDIESGQVLSVDSTSAFPFARSFSPDGRYLTYATSLSSASQINVVSVDGTESYALPGIRGFGAQFTSDGQGMIIEAPRSIHFLPIRISPSFGVRGTQKLILNAPYADGFDALGNEKVYLVASAVQFSGGEDSRTNLVWLQNWSAQLQKEIGQ
jgi:serine/threonine protein kinase